MVTEALFSPNWKKCTAKPEDSIEKALTLLSNEGLLIVSLLDNHNRLLGVVSDSDIRKALLRGATLATPLREIMTADPVTAPPDFTADKLRSLSRATAKREIPIVDHHGNLKDIFVLGLHESKRHAVSGYHPSHSHAAFILAGGLGSRLRSAVPDRPKPLAEIEGRAIIDYVVENLKSNGFRRFYLSLNYMADRIEQHIHSQTKLYQDLDIKFIKENKKLGTAGSLSYLHDRETQSILVCNADILTRLSFFEVLHEHEDQHAAVTCVVKPYEVKVPYGVVQLRDDIIADVQEKPVFSFCVNAGIYVLRPSVINQIPANEHLDMPDLMRSLIAEKQKVIPFMMHEYWLDIGTPEDLYRANEDAAKLFDKPAARDLSQG